MPTNVNTGTSNNPPPKRTSSSKKSLKKLSLEQIIGCTSPHNSAFAINPITGEIAYPGGCVVIIYSSQKNKQMRFLSNQTNKPIVSLCYSSNGKYLAVGESGHQPSIIVWEVATKTLMCELKGHTFGISSLSFSPNGKYLLSIGFQHDAHIILWEWKSSSIVSSNKLKQKVYSASFSEDGTYFVTAGIKHIKFWYLDSQGNAKKTEKTFTVPNKKPSFTLEGKLGANGTHKDNEFVDLACGKGAAKGNVYCVTTKGLLCLFSSTSRVMEKWVSLKASGVYAVSVTEKMVVCACSNGIIRVFDPITLEYMATLPRPHVLGREYLGKESVTVLPNPSSMEVYPDALCCRLSGDSMKLGCVYSDRSLFVWDLKNLKQIGKYRSFLSHSGCIWDVDVFPDAVEGQRSPFPPGSFVTCSSDSSIKIWNTNGPSLDSQRNIFGKEVLKTFYLGDDFSSMKAKDFSANATEGPTSSTEGIRCVKVSGDGQLLASGDRKGNLRVHDLHNLSLLSFNEAHDAEILSLSFSSRNGGKEGEEEYLATASRDRLIHIFNVNQNFSLLHTLADHSSSITSVNFAANGSKLLSCGADKTIFFRDVQKEPFDIHLYHACIAQYGTVYDMDVDATNKFIVTAGQEKKLNIFSLSNGKLSRSYKADSDSGELIKVKLDPAGLYAATSSSDKHIRLYDFFSGECISKVSGHSELVTGLAFSRDCTRLISVSGDGCIFIWKLSADVTANIMERLQELNQEKPKKTSPPISPLAPPSSTEEPERPISLVRPQGELARISALELDFGSKTPSRGKREASVVLDDLASIPESPGVANFRLSDANLPSWAKSKQQSIPAKAESNIPKPGGRWAQRIERDGGVPMFSELSEDRPVAKWADKIDRRFTVEIKSFSDQTSNQIRLNNNNREEDDDVTYSSDPEDAPLQEKDIEVEDVGEENVEEEEETKGIEEGNEEESIYLEENQNQNFEAPSVEEDPQNSNSKEEEGTETEEAEQPRQVEEQFMSIEKADFLKDNFGNLSIQNAPNPLRLSFSSRYRGANPDANPIAEQLAQQQATILAANAQLQSHPIVADEFAAAQRGRARQQNLLDDVEKTRARLAQLGIHIPPRTSSLEKSITPTSENPPSTVNTSQSISPQTTPKSNALPSAPSSTASSGTSTPKENSEEEVLDFILRSGDHPKSPLATSKDPNGKQTSPVSSTLRGDCQRAVSQLEQQITEVFRLIHLAKNQGDAVSLGILEASFLSSIKKMNEYQGRESVGGVGVESNPLNQTSSSLGQSSLSQTQLALLGTDNIAQSMADMIVEKLMGKLSKSASP